MYVIDVGGGISSGRINLIAALLVPVTINLSGGSSICASSHNLIAEGIGRLNLHRR